jgi:predicted MFS family arabinose efflux permease
LGVPLGTWLGTLTDWRTAFAIMSFLTLILIAWVVAKVPDYPGQAPGEGISLARVFTTNGVRPVLSVVIAWMLAHNILYTYVAPFVVQAGLSDRVDLVLLVFGVAALIGIWIAGKLVDRHLRRAVLTSLLAFAVTSAAFGIWAGSPSILFVGVVIWGVTFGGAATLLQTALADTAGDGADVALSMNVVAWNGAIAGGGIIGGVLLDTWGASSFPWALTAFLIVGLLIAWSAKHRGFRPGPRLSTGEVRGH